MGRILDIVLFVFFCIWLSFSIKIWRRRSTAISILSALVLHCGVMLIAEMFALWAFLVGDPFGQLLWVTIFVILLVIPFVAFLWPRKQ